ncbi:MAG: T9SS type A sorting domain-containing protein [Ferruginibacter sp.]|nr:T9SS type A sorting domain-containing protein [Ferruginibacter sp.]
MGASTAFVDNSTVVDMLPTCGPILHLDASAGVTADVNGNVSQWNDQGPNAHHATQATATKMPKRFTNQINNKFIIRFDGTDDEMQTPVVNLSTVQAAEVFIVSKTETEGYPIYHANAAGDVNNFHVIENNTSGTNGLSAMMSGNGTDAVSFKSDNIYQCYKRYNIAFDKALTGLAQINIWANGTALTNSNGTVSGAEITNNLGNYPFFIGGAPGSSSLHFNGDIAEIIVYNKALTTSQRNSLNNYLKNKYFGTAISTQFSAVPLSQTSSNAITDDGKWKHSYSNTNNAEIIASVKDNNCSTTGQRTDIVYVEATAGLYGGQYCMRRHYVINPSTELPGTKRVRLYYTNADFADLQVVVPSLTSHNQLVVTQYDGPNEDGVFDASSGTLTFIPAASITTGTVYGNRYLEFDVSGFSEFWIHAGNSVLPIQLTSFTAQEAGNKYVLLQWKTASEQNSNRFEVERSADGFRFIKIGQVLASGNSTTEKQYQLIDRSPFRGLNYYRLKQVDLDNHSSFSSVRRVELDLVKYFTIVNNPSNGMDVIFKTNYISGTLIISDLTGRQILKKDVNAGTFRIGTSHLPNGMYWATLLSNGIKLQTLKVIVNSR